MLTLPSKCCKCCQIFKCPGWSWSAIFASSIFNTIQAHGSPGFWRRAIPKVNYRRGTDYIIQVLGSHNWLGTDFYLFLMKSKYWCFIHLLIPLWHVFKDYLLCASIAPCLNMQAVESDCLHLSSPASCSLAEWSWASFITFLDLGFLFYEMGVLGYCDINVGLKNVKHFADWLV